jgi:hypothetical protein
MADILTNSTPAVSAINASQPRKSGQVRAAVSAIIGWTWRILAGAFFCFNVPLLSYLTSILVVGWLNRWMRARVLHHWWRQSPVRTTEDPETLGLPWIRPRWVLPETPRRAPAIWLNFKEGLATLFCIYLVLGWGCWLRLFSWEMGWLNSFNKGYEQAWIGPTTGIIGSLLFALGIIYVPLARVHMAVTGEMRAFFEARLIWRLIRARLLGFTLFLAALLLLTIPQEIFKAMPHYLHELDNWRTASNARLLEQYCEYLRSVAFWLFVSLLILHALAARLYRSAMLAALREGLIHPEDLTPSLREYLDRLELIPEVTQRSGGLIRVLRWTWNWYVLRVLYTAVLLISLLFVAKSYASYFIVARPFAEFMNDPLLQFPCVDYVPLALTKQ